MSGDEIQITDSENETLKQLEEADTGPSTLNKPLIQKVAQILSSCYSTQECERYFKPTSVAMGPLHHEKDTERDSRYERGEKTEKCKRQLAAKFIKATKRTKEDFYKNVKKNINSLRECYDAKELEEWTDEELAWMFLVDGCALFCFMFLDVCDDEWEEFSGINDLVTIAKVDLFLLENQLPYQLLEILMSVQGEEIIKERLKELITKFINKSFLRLSEQQQHQIREEIIKKPLKELITKFINKGSSSPTEQQQHPIPDDIRPDSPHQQQEQIQFEVDPPPEQEEDRRHLLGLLRRRLLMGVKLKEKGEKQKQVNNSHSQQGQNGFWWRLGSVGDQGRHWHTLRTVKELKDKGIRFKASEKGRVITDIDFNDHCFMPTLTLAPICLHNTTMPMLLNLIAYELCPNFQNRYEITSHMSFLDSLIDDAEDVKELRHAGLLHNGLGSDEAVAELFNKISDILLPNLTIHSKLKRNIQAYCNSDIAHFCSLRASVETKLTQTYFRSPWSFLVFLGALAGLVMTGLQTYNSFHEE